LGVYIASRLPVDRLDDLDDLVSTVEAATDYEDTVDLQD
nr:hypothetical protein [Tanacetum cinerariifolium]